MTQAYTLYILECKNNAFYVGYTTDLRRRYQEHVAGSAKCKYTRSFPPKRICSSWTFYCGLSDILSIERGVKQLTRAKKEQLVGMPDKLLDWWPDYAAMLSDTSADV